MKNTSLPIFICSVMFLFAACGPTNENAESTETEQTKAENAEEAIVEVAEEDKVAQTYAVSGMVCKFGCAKFIEEEVSGHAGVLDFKVDYEAETAEIVYDNKRTNSEEIIAFVEGLNEGKYSMTEFDPALKKAHENSENLKDTVGTNMENTADVSIPRMDNFKFSFPKVITYFMRRL